MRILAYPRTSSPYLDCFYDAVCRRQVEVVAGELSGRWMWSTLRREDWVHLHWPSFLYKPKTPTLLASLARFLRFLVLFSIVRLRGARIVWTAHNLHPHDKSRIPVLDIAARHLVVGASTFIFVHGPTSEVLLLERFPHAKGKTIVINHGAWFGYYRDDMGRDEARRILGLPLEAHVFLFFGLCKPYKNLEDLISAFNGLEVQPHRPAVLLIAGHFQDAGYRHEIEKLIAGRVSIRLVAKYIPDDDVQIYLNACDALVAPYREILTSGTAFLAMTFGRPLISLAAGNLLDVVTSETGILYDPRDTTALTSAMQAALTTEFSTETIRNRARLFSWDESAAIFTYALRMQSAAHPGHD